METNHTTQPEDGTGTKNAVDQNVTSESLVTPPSGSGDSSGGTNVEALQNALEEFMRPEAAANAANVTSADAVSQSTGDGSGHDGTGVNAGDGDGVGGEATTPEAQSVDSGSQNKAKTPTTPQASSGKATGATRRHERQAAMAAQGKKSTSTGTTGKVSVEAKATKEKASTPAKAPTPPTTPVVAAKPDTRPTAVLMLHTGKWKPGMWQYDLAAVVAKHNNCNATRTKAADAEYQRAMTVQGAKTNIVTVEKEYKHTFDAIRDNGMLVHKALIKAKPDEIKDREEAIPAWGPFINRWGAGAVEQYASMVGVVFTPQRAPSDTKTTDYEAGREFAKSYFRQDMRQQRAAASATTTPSKDGASASKDGASPTKGKQAAATAGEKKEKEEAVA